MFDRIAKQTESCIESHQTSCSGGDPFPCGGIVAFHQGGMAQQAGTESNGQQTQRGVSLPNGVVRFRTHTGVMAKRGNNETKTETMYRHFGSTFGGTGRRHNIETLAYSGRHQEAYCAVGIPGTDGWDAVPFIRRSG